MSLPHGYTSRCIDEGVGFDRAERAVRLAKRRFGLAQLRERVRAAGGTVISDQLTGRRMPGDGSAASISAGAREPSAAGKKKPGHARAYPGSGTLGAFRPGVCGGCRG